MNKELFEKLYEDTVYMRIKSLEMSLAAGSVGAHLGGGLSMIEIMAVLYGAVMKYKTEDPTWPERDRFILSKGHGTLAYYTALCRNGFFDEKELLTFKKNETFLYGHPYMNPEKGIEFSSGSLGLGLSLGIGSALASLRRSLGYRVFVLMGDGEINEGTVWEAAVSASHFGLNNLIAIVDQNKIQYDGQTCDVMNMGDLDAKWSSFGWDVSVIDGHDINALFDALNKKTDKPHAVIAETVKGKGVSFMEHNPAWHHSRLSQSQYEQALAEQGGNN